MLFMKTLWLTTRVSSVPTYMNMNFMHGLQLLRCWLVDYQRVCLRLCQPVCAVMDAYYF
jgi:hypothetical protein